jgi:hypothetical protein
VEFVSGQMLASLEEALASRDALHRRLTNAELLAEDLRTENAALAAALAAAGPAGTVPVTGDSAGRREERALRRQLELELEAVYNQVAAPRAVKM